MSHVHGLARPAETRFQHREAYLHAKHEEGSDERPGRIDRINDVGRLNGGGGLRVDTGKEGASGNSNDH